MSSRIALASPWRLTPTTMPSSVHCICQFRATTFKSLLGKLQPHGAIALGVLAPPLPHLDEQKKVYLGVRNFGNFLSRRLADSLDRLSALAKHDLPLAFPFHVDRL